MNAINLFDHIFSKPLWEGFSRLEFSTRKVPNLSIWIITKCTHSYLHTVHKHTHNNTHAHGTHGTYGTHGIRHKRCTHGIHDIDGIHGPYCTHDIRKMYVTHCTHDMHDIQCGQNLRETKIMGNYPTFE